MILIVAAMFVGTYVGNVILKGNMKGTDATIIPQPTEASSTPSFLHFGLVGEYVGFTIAGAVGGLFVGYLMPSLFEQKNTQVKRENDV